MLLGGSLVGFLRWLSYAAQEPSAVTTHSGLGPPTPDKPIVKTAICLFIYPFIFISY